MSVYRALAHGLAVAICLVAGCRTQDRAAPVNAPARSEDTTIAADSAGDGMTTDPSIKAPHHQLPAPEIARAAPEIVMAAPEHATIAEQFRAPAALEARAGQPFRLLMQAGTANSPDQVAIRSARIDDRRIAIDLELRAF